MWSLGGCGLWGFGVRKFMSSRVLVGAGVVRDGVSGLWRGFSLERYVGFLRRGVGLEAFGESKI